MFLSTGMPAVVAAKLRARRRISREAWEDLAERAQYRARNLAALCNWSMRHLQREFRHDFGRAPQDWLNERRLLAARDRLLSGEPIKKIAADLGYKEISHFYHQFKAANRMTPSEFAALRNPGMPECRPQTKNVAR
jgi:AraC-like DNA-binding protein